MCTHQVLLAEPELFWQIDVMRTKPKFFFNKVTLEQAGVENDSDLALASAVKKLFFVTKVM